MNSPSTESVPPPIESPTPMSLMARLTNIYAAPAEVFEHIRLARFNASNWLVPALIFVLVSWVGAFLVFSQPNVEQQIREVTAKAFEEQVARGKLTSQQAEQAQAITEKWAVVGAKIAGYAAPPFMAVFSVFGWALLIWLVGTKVLKGSFGYMKAVETSGLCLMIGTLDAIIRSLLIMITGSLWAAPSPVLLIKDFDPQSALHGALSLANVIVIWALAVRAIALSRLSGRGFGISALWIFGLWLTWSALAIGGGAIARAVGGR